MFLQQQRRIYFETNSREVSDCPYNCPSILFRACCRFFLCVPK